MMGRKVVTSAVKRVTLLKSVLRISKGRNLDNRAQSLSVAPPDNLGKYVTVRRDHEDPLTQSRFDRFPANRVLI